MKLIIKNGQVIAVHANNQNVKEFYEDSEIIRVPDSTKLETAIKAPTANINVSGVINVPSVDLPEDPRLKWNLQENKENALAVIEDIAEEYRSEILTSMPGRIAGYEAKAKIADRIIFAENNPDQNDVDALKPEADTRGITVLELAKLIIKRSENFANISIYIDGEALRIKTIITNAESSEVIWNALKEFEQNILTKIN